MHDTQESNAKSDCYSAGERQWMEYGQQMRASLLKPLLSQLSHFKVTPDAVTFVAGATGLGFIPLWLLDQKIYALVCLCVHVLLDGLDGPLARYQNTASSRGSFTDTFADQLVVTGVTIAWIIADATTGNIAVGTAYVFLYAMVVAMAMVRNALSAPYSWLVRPRFFVYLAVALDFWLASNPTFYVLLICDCLLAIKCASGFLVLRSQLPGPKAPRSRH